MLYSYWKLYFRAKTICFTFVSAVFYPISLLNSFTSRASKISSLEMLNPTSMKCTRLRQTSRSQNSSGEMRRRVVCSVETPSRCQNAGGRRTTVRSAANVLRVPTRGRREIPTETRVRDGWRTPTILWFFFFFSASNDYISRHTIRHTAAVASTDGRVLYGLLSVYRPETDRRPSPRSVILLQSGHIGSFASARHTFSI